jgi:hypothetical protein
MLLCRGIPNSGISLVTKLDPLRVSHSQAVNIWIQTTWKGYEKRVKKRLWNILQNGQEEAMKKTPKNVPRIPRDKLWESTNIFGHFLTASFARWCPAVSLQLQFSRVRYLPWLPSFTHTAVPTTVCYHHLYFSIFVALFHHFILMMEYIYYNIIILYYKNITIYK